MSKKHKDTFSLTSFGLRRYFTVGTHDYPIEKTEVVEETSIPKEISRIIDSFDIDRKEKKKKDEGKA